MPSPALLKPRHDRFVGAVQAFASDRHVPFVSFERVTSKDAFVAPYRARFTAREGVVLIGVAQEKMRSFKAHKRLGRNHHTPVFDFSRQSVAVNHYYFYVHDREWGAFNSGPFTLPFFRTVLDKEAERRILRGACYTESSRRQHPRGRYSSP